MFSTSTKIAFGFILLTALLFGAIGYIYRQMNLLTAPTGIEETISARRKTTHQIVTKLYDAEIIGQTLRAGSLDEYPRYRKTMKETGVLIDSLRNLLTDTLQQAQVRHQAIGKCDEGGTGFCREWDPALPAVG